MFDAIREAVEEAFAGIRERVLDAWIQESWDEYAPALCVCMCVCVCECVSVCECECVHKMKWKRTGFQCHLADSTTPVKRKFLSTLDSFLLQTMELTPALDVMIAPPLSTASLAYHLWHITQEQILYWPQKFSRTCGGQYWVSLLTYQASCSFQILEPLWLIYIYIYIYINIYIVD